MRLAFVLLKSATQPSAEAIARAHVEMFASVPAPRAEKSGPEQCTLNVGGDDLVVGLLPAAVPYGEAEAAARFSIASFGPAGAIAPHAAHLMVVYNSHEDRPTIGSLQRFTRMLAAICATTDAVGVYWGDAGATHPAQFFLEVATDKAIEMPMFLWTGMSVASAGAGRTSLLSTGMWPQLRIPDLEMIAPSANANAALGFFFDMLAYVARRGTVPNDGETIGRTPAEKWVVRHGKSPIDPERPTWRVDLPPDFA